MSKNLINSAGDFLHLYLGCPVLVTPYEGASYECKLCGVSIEKVGGETEIKVQVFEDDGPDGYEGHGHKWFNEDEIELLLRPITKMTEQEKKEIWRLIFSQGHGDQFQDRFKEFTGSIRVINEKTYYQVPREVMMQGVERLGIESDGTIWADCDLHLWRHNQHSVTKWLLSKGFDLFDLIKAGLAIDSTERVGVN